MEKENKILLGKKSYSCVIIILWYICSHFRLKKFEIMMVLSPGQFYCVSLCKEKSSIQLDIILDRSTEESAENRKQLVDFFQSALEQICQEIMAAAKRPIVYIKCPHCSKLHIKYTNFLEGRTQLCGVKSISPSYYQDLYSKLVTFSTMLNSLIYIVTSTGTCEAEQMKCKHSTIYSYIVRF